LRRWHARGLIHRGAPPFPPHESGLYLFGVDIIERALKHPALPQAPAGAYQEMRKASAAQNFAWDQMTRWMLLSDAPRHGQLRRPVAALFSEASVAQLEAHARHDADALIQAAAARGTFDLVADIFVPFALNGLSRFLGVAIDDFTWFKRRTAQLARVLDLRRDASWEEANIAMRDLRAFAAAAVERPVPKDPPQLVDAMLDLERTGQWTRGDVVDSTTLFLLSGQETIIDALGNAVAALAAHPDEPEKLRRGLAVDDRVVDELLRF